MFLPSGISADKVLSSGYEKWLDLLTRFLQSAPTLHEKVYGLKQTTYSVQFTYKGYIEVELLVSPFWYRPDDLYGFLNRLQRDKLYR